MKSIINYLSINKKENQKYPKCDIPDVWESAQRLQEHIYEIGNAQYTFPNALFFKQNHDLISKNLIELHLFANIYSKNLEDYENRRIFWIFDNNKKVYILIRVI